MGIFHKATIPEKTFSRDVICDNCCKRITAWFPFETKLYLSWKSPTILYKEPNSSEWKSYPCPNCGAK